MRVQQPEYYVTNDWQAACRYEWRNKKPGREEANPHAGFLNINLVSLADLAIGDPISVSSRLPT